MKWRAAERRRKKWMRVGSTSSKRRRRTKKQKRIRKRKKIQTLTVNEKHVIDKSTFTHGRSTQATH